MGRIDYTPEMLDQYPSIYLLITDIAVLFDVPT